MERRNLRAFRAKKGLSQEEMASEIGVSRSAYVAMEGGSNCRVSSFEALQRKFGLPDGEVWELAKTEGGNDDGKGK